MKKNILFLANGGSNWMGGIYYVKNQAAQLLSYKPARENINIYLYVNEKSISEYKKLLLYKNVHFIREENIQKKFFCRFCRKLISNLDADLIYLVLRYQISYIFPYFPVGKDNKRFLLRRSISWIADFQHIHFPQFFSRYEYLQREKRYYEIARNHNKLVLSSRDAYRDFISKYGGKNEKIYIIPFCSMLDKCDVMSRDVERTKLKYGIEGDYFIVCNQFWQHKNHMIIFESLSQAIIHKPDIKVVCTGKMQDYRNQEYVNQIRNYITGMKLEDSVFLLGMISKKDQIQLMNGAKAVIQPSLFEGWGTVVEDAKTLRKRILLSDISVHHEQKNSLCTLFNPYDADELAEKMEEVWNEENILGYHYSIKDGEKFGKLFYKMICS